MIKVDLRGTIDRRNTYGKGERQKLEKNLNDMKAQSDDRRCIVD